MPTRPADELEEPAEAGRKQRCFHRPAHEHAQRIHPDGWRMAGRQLRRAAQRRAFVASKM
ncbi:MAG TPA: hypothetical protein VKC57_04215 [Ktedonobacterales bacterium]|nr:hypothetical protein [Ktedonobacterales bacterium]